MPEIVGDLAVRIVPDGSQLPGAIAAMLSKTAGQLNNIPMNVNTSQASQNIAALGNQIQNDIGGGLASAALQAAGFTAAIYGAKAAVEGIVNKFAGLYDPLVKATAGFNAILGQEKGSKLLEQIRQFAKDSPFVTGELVSYSQQLLGVGQSADTIIPLLGNVGDLIASLGGDQQNISRVLFVLTQIRSIGRLAGQDAMQLQSAQIPITKLLAESLGKSQSEIKKMQMDGKITADQVFSALSTAGEKVKGSMDAVTRSIGGAKSVLTDTVTIMLQNQPALKHIYDDIVLSIKAIANALGKPEVQAAADQFFGAVGRAYDALKPLVVEMAKFSGKLGFQGLKIATDLLTVLANVLESIPTPVLTLVADALATMAMLRAPMMLLKYVESLKTLTTIFTPGGAAGLLNKIKGTTEAVEQQATSMSRAAKVATLFGTAMVVAGQVISSTDAASKSARVSAVGGALSGAGAGLAFGAQTGNPYIAAGGAIAGGLIGGFSAFLHKSDEIEKALIAKFAAAGAASANAFIIANRGILEGKGESAVATLQKRIAELQAMSASSSNMVRINQQNLRELQVLEGARDFHGDYMDVGAAGTAQDRRTTGTQLENRGYLNPNMGGLTPQGVARLAELTAVRQRIIDGAKQSDKTNQAYWASEIKTNQDASDAITHPYEVAINEILKINPKLRSTFAEVDKTMKEFGNVNTPKTIGNLRLDPTGLDEFNRNVLVPMGLSFDDLATKGPAVIEGIINRFLNMPSAVQAATTAVTAFNTAITESKTLTGLEAFKTRIDTFKSGIEAANALKTALARPTDPFASVQAILSGANAEKSQVYATSLGKEKFPDSGEAKARATAAATQAANLLAAQSFEKLQKSLGYTNEEYDALLVATGAYELRQATLGALTDTNASMVTNYSSAIGQLATNYDVASGKSTGLETTLGNAARMYNLTAREVAKLVGIQGQINPKMQITVTADIDRAARALAILRTMAQGTKSFLQSIGVTMTTFGLPDTTGARYYDPFPDLKTGGGGGGGKGGGGGNKLDQAAQSLGDAFKGAAETIKNAAKELEKSIKESTQYEKAVSAGKATKNALQQAADLTFVNSGIEQLKARGVSEGVLTALGINDGADVKQVKKLLGSSDAELATLTKAVGTRDKAAEDLATKRASEDTKKLMTEAIIAAAKALGYKNVTADEAKAIAGNIGITLDATDPAVAALVKELLAQVKSANKSKR